MQGRELDLLLERHNSHRSSELQWISTVKHSSMENKKSKPVCISHLLSQARQRTRATCARSSPTPVQVLQHKYSSTMAAFLQEPCLHFTSGQNHCVFEQQACQCGAVRPGRHAMESPKNQDVSGCSGLSLTPVMGRVCCSLAW